MPGVRHFRRATCTSVDIYTGNIPEHVFDSMPVQGVSTIEAARERRWSCTRLSTPSVPVHHLSGPHQLSGQQAHQRRSQRPTNVSSSPPTRYPSCARTPCTSPKHPRRTSTRNLETWDRPTKPISHNVHSRPCHSVPKLSCTPTASPAVPRSPARARDVPRFPRLVPTLRPHKRSPRKLCFTSADGATPRRWKTVYVSACVRAQPTTTEHTTSRV